MEQVYSKSRINQRKTIVEHPFGTLKTWKGKIPLLLKGKEKVSTEINIYTMVYNIRRLLNIEEFDEILVKIAGWICWVMV